MVIVLVRSIANGMYVDDISGASPTRSLLNDLTTTNNTANALLCLAALATGKNEAGKRLAIEWEWDSLVGWNGIGWEMDLDSPFVNIVGTSTRIPAVAAQQHHATTVISPFVPTVYSKPSSAPHDAHAHSINYFADNITS
jgi:hypothetical protein